MRCSILPPNAKSINDAMRLNDPMQWLMKHARKNESAFSIRITGICSACGNVDKLENHHIVPVWVYALGKCIDANLTDFQSYKSFWIKATRNEINIFECNDHQNLIRLCSLCHDVEDKKAYQVWKDYFESHHSNVFFGTKNGDKMDKLIQKDVEVDQRRA